MAVVRPIGKPYQTPDSVDDPCPHQHFKCDIIDRRILSRKQHLNLLCTPKGYRWVIADTGSTKNGLCKKKPGKTHNILAEIWDLLTPAMINCMKETLMVEFGLSEAAATEFICHSRQDTFFSADPIRKGNTKQNKTIRRDDRPPEGSSCSCYDFERSLWGKNEFANGIDPLHIKAFSKVVSSKFAEYVAAMTCAKRDSKHRTLAEVILNELCNITGEETTLDNPGNRLHKILTTTADRMALWLRQNMMDDDEMQRNRRRWHEDNIVKKRKIFREKERNRRQKENDRMKRGNELNEKRMAREKAEKEEIALKEKEQKKLERQKRHHEMEKYREDEKRKRKEETEKAKKDSELENTRVNPVMGASGPPKVTNYQKRLQSTTKHEGNRSFKSRLAPAKKSQSGLDPQDAAKQPAMDDIKKTNPKVIANSVSFGDSPSKSLSLANNIVKNSASAFDSREKIGLTPISSMGKLAESVSSHEKLPTNAGSKNKHSISSNSQHKSVDINTSEKPSPGVSSTIMKSTVASSQAKSATTESSHTKLGTALGSMENLNSKISTVTVERTSSSSPEFEVRRTSSSEAKQKIENLKRELVTTLISEQNSESKTSIVTVKRTSISSPKFEVRRTSYSEAKQKIETLKRKSASLYLPPNVPFDPNDPQSLAKSIEHSLKVAEDWGHWIDKTIQDAKKKIISYQGRAVGGRIEPADLEDWNRFVEQMNEEALRWKRQMKAMDDTYKKSKPH